MEDNSIARRFGRKPQGADQPLPNRAQRRADAKHRRSQQRKAQKGYDRQRRAEERAQVAAQRELRLKYGVEQAFWNGLPTFALRGTAIVADAPEFPNYWAREEGLVGERIPVVCVVLDGVNHGGGKIYLDDRTGQGWAKVTTGHGSPAYGHAEIGIEADSFEGDI